MKLSSLRSPILMTRQSFLFLIEMIALLLKIIVLLLLRGRDSFENTSPTTNAWTMQPSTEEENSRVISQIKNMFALTCLQADQHYGLCALGGGVPGSVAYSVLGLQREEKTSSKPVCSNML